MPRRKRNTERRSHRLSPVRGKPRIKMSSEAREKSFREGDQEDRDETFGLTESGLEAILGPPRLTSDI